MLFYKKNKKKHDLTKTGLQFTTSAVGLSVGSSIVGSVSQGTAVSGTVGSGLSTLSRFQSPMASVYGGGVALGMLSQLDYGQKKKRNKKNKQAERIY